MKRQTAIFFYVLSAYVVLQFAWWGFHLIELSKLQVQGNRRIFMIIGEGLVFFIILLAGLWQIRRSIKKELELTKNQNNFMLSVTHELKTPLAANKLLIQTLLKRKLSEDKQAELASKAIEENQRLESMIDNILYATRIDSGKFKLHKEKLNLNHLFEQTKMRFSKVNEQIDFEIECPPNLYITADPFLIEIVMNNLTENAVKYGDKKFIKYFALDNGDKVVFGVQNSGSTITKKQEDAIFQKFYRLEDENTRSAKGTGLGLYICKEIIKIHKGKIEVNATFSETTNFTVILPQ